MLVWWSLSLGIGAVTIVQLLLLNRRRRLLIPVPPQPSAVIRRSEPAAKTVEPAPPSARPVAEPAPRLAERPATELLTAALPAGAATDAGVLYIDAAGHCTLADAGARRILDWRGGERTLRDVLAGGDQESTTLLNELAQQGAVDVYPTALAGPAAAPVEVSAVALRDRDDNLWGAALFIHRSSAAASLRRVDL